MNINLNILMRKNRFSLTDMLIGALIDFAFEQAEKEQKKKEFNEKFRVVIKRNWLGFTSYEFHEREKPVDNEKES